MNLVECKNLSKKYVRKYAVDHVDLKIKKGKIIGLLGPNGSGKSTLIKLLNQIIYPTDGSILINGENPGINSKKIISYLPERNYLNLNMKVKDAVKYFADFYEDFDSKKAESLLKKFDIEMNDKLKTLSKGMKEKVQLVLVMSRKAELYILDEPIGGVDPATRDEILDTILTNFNEGASIIISTHLIADIERILDEVIFIKKGKIILHKSTDEIRKESGESIDAYFREAFKC